MRGQGFRTVVEANGLRQDVVRALLADEPLLTKAGAIRVAGLVDGAEGCLVVEAPHPVSPHVWVLTPDEARALRDALGARVKDGPVPAADAEADTGAKEARL